MKIDFKDKKTLIISIVCIVLIILICVGLICLLIKNNSNKISRLYNDLQKAEKYSFILKQDDGYQIIMAKKGNETSIDMQGEDVHTTTIVKDGKAYFVNHDEKTYSTYDEMVANENILLDELSELSKKEYSKGNEKIDKKSYSYEEYKGYSGFMYSSNIDVEEENINTKFYFKGKDIKYIKTIISEDETEKIETSLSYEPDDSLFNIPEDYEEAK